MDMTVHTAAIFDLDGVIIDSGPLHMEAWKMVLEDHGIHFDEKKFRALYGMRDTEVIPRLIGIMDDEKIDMLKKQKGEIYEKLIIHYARPVKGLAEFIAYLHQRNIKTTIASSAEPIVIAYILTAIEMTDQFEVVVTGTQPMRSKPAPDIFLMAAYRLGLTPSQCVVFEDAISGVEAARTAGMTVVALTTSFLTGELSHADLVVENFCDPRLKTLF